MDAATRDAQVRKFVAQVWNDGNYEAAADLYGESYVNAFGTGPSARVEPIRRYHAAFPDLRMDIEELILAGDVVVMRATFRGTDTGGYVGRPPTGRSVEEWVVFIMHFEDDRVVREWIGADKLGVFIQLGVVDDPWTTQVEEPVRIWSSVVSEDGRRSLAAWGRPVTCAGSWPAKPLLRSGSASPRAWPARSTPPATP